MSHLAIGLVVWGMVFIGALLFIRGAGQQNTRNQSGD